MEINKSEFLEAGVQFGHYKNQNNPNMKKFIFTTKGGVSIIDLKKIMSYSLSAYEQIKNLASTGAEILFVNKKKHASEIMKNAALDCSCPFMVKKWPGGFLTNFQTVSKEINKITYLSKSNSQNKSISKKEKSRNDKKLRNLNDCYEGVISLKKLPDAIFVFGLKSAERSIVKEAVKLGIKVIALCDTDTNPRFIDCIMLGNDDGLKSSNFFINLVSKAVKEGKLIYESKNGKGSWKGDEVVLNPTHSSEDQVNKS